MIKVEILADSINDFGDRITTMKVTFPRIILAEMNTHRMFSRNSASSRAIPFKKMVESVNQTPFVPIAWQEDHKGMQGNEYLDDKPASYLNSAYVANIKARDILNGYWNGGEYEWPDGSALYQMSTIAKLLNDDKATKQIANRLLEPFMWHTAIITSTEWDNFFDLRCPQYEQRGEVFKSKKDSIKHFEKMFGSKLGLPTTDLEWLKVNKGQAEIHMMATAEAMYDALQESKPERLNAGDWHIPFKDHINDDIILQEIADKEEVKHLDSAYEIYQYYAIKISTAMCARVSYTTIGEEKEINYKTLIGIHDRMVKQRPFHASPFEHIAECMDFTDCDLFLKIEDGVVEERWCRNFRGYKQYRFLVESGKIKY